MDNVPVSLETCCLLEELVFPQGSRHMTLLVSTSGTEILQFSDGFVIFPRVNA